MFTSPRPNFYESSDGFSVEVLGQTGLAYREPGRRMFVDAEVVMGSSGLMLYRDSISRWDAPNEADPVDAAERQRILENIRQAFLFQGFEIDVI